MMTYPERNNESTEVTRSELQNVSYGTNFK